MARPGSELNDVERSRGSGPAAWSDLDARNALRAMFKAAVAAADPAKVLAQHLPDPPKGRCVVVGAGKAAAAMAAAVEAAWSQVDLSGTVVTPYGYGAKTTRIVVREASHPLPDAASEAAAREMLTIVKDLTSDDLVLALISGGGSAVMALPVEGVTLEDKQAVGRALLASGLDIVSMNAVRRRLSAIKGGKLGAAAAPARVVTLAISDIPGDDIAAIASGPTIPDRDAGRDLKPIADRLQGMIPALIYERLVASAPQNVITEAVDARLIANPRAALEAAARVARTADLDVFIVGDDLEGESRTLAEQMAQRATQGFSRPTVLLSGGETTVTLAGRTTGRGGRNTEFALAFALAVKGAAGIWVLAADTDGEDGASGGGAGAIAGPDSLARAKSTPGGIDAHDHLDRHDSASFFAALGDLIVTGPTCTNVNDFRAVLVVPS